MRQHAVRRAIAACAVGLTLTALAGCTDSGGGEGPGDDPYGDSVHGGERVFRDPAKLPTFGMGTARLSPDALAPEVRRDGEQIQAEWGFAITGDWTPEAIALLRRVLLPYRETRPLLANLEGIHMTEVGDIGEYSDDTAGLLEPSGCKVDGDGDGECLDVEEDNPQGGEILLWGARSRWGEEQTREEILQHEIGHYFAVAVASDESWRARFRAAAEEEPPVSAYGGINEEENYAEVWAKLFTAPEVPADQYPWENPILPHFQRKGIRRETHAVLREIIRGPMRADLLPGEPEEE